MTKWSDWMDVDLAGKQNGSLDDFGVYQIRAVNKSGNPIPIGRLAGVDPLGILYVGRSGFRRQKTNRTVANRVREFVRQAHSGGITYARANKILKQVPQFSDHQLQVRAKVLPDDKIDVEESNVLRKYFKKYAELPPCNSALPKAK